jgi:hypothetical protein
MMVESAQDRAGSDGADALNWTPERRVFVQRTVGSDFIVVAAITSKDSAQVRLPYDNDVVKTFAADCSDQPFGKAVLPRRATGDRPVPVNIIRMKS